jgi:tRNA G26 N,N-dimethylase Trm1
VRGVAAELDTFSFYDMHVFAANMGLSARPTGEVIEALRSKGFLASPTHVTGTGIKTDACASDLQACITELARG